VGGEKKQKDQHENMNLPIPSISVGNIEKLEIGPGDKTTDHNITQIMIIALTHSALG
jgi:hypothetical protein